MVTENCLLSKLSNGIISLQFCPFQKHFGAFEDSSRSDEKLVVCLRVELSTESASPTTNAYTLALIPNG